MSKASLKALAIGLGLIIINIILDLGVCPSKEVQSIWGLYWFLTILSKLSVSIGLALVTGTIAANLKKVDSLTSLLSRKDKKKVLNEIFPQCDEINIFKINRIEKLNNNCSRYRSNTNYDITIKEENNKLFAISTLSYTEHYLNLKRKPENIYMVFDNTTPYCYIEFVEISTPTNTNDSIRIEKDKIKVENIKAHGSKLEYKNYVQIPSQFKKSSSLNVKVGFVFEGYDHWLTYGVILQCPTKNIHFTINNPHNIKIKDSVIFDDTSLYDVSTKENCLTINSNQWLSSYSGFTMVVAK